MLNFKASCMDTLSLPEVVVQNGLGGMPNAYPSSRHIEVRPEGNRADLDGNLTVLIIKRVVSDSSSYQPAM